MNLIIKRGILIPRAFPFYSRIKQVLDIENPAYGKALNLGLPLYNIDPSIRCYKEVKQGLIVPIGFIAELMKIKQKYNLDFEIEDHRCAQEPRYSFSFFGELRPEQERAVDHMFRFSCGVLEAPGGSGKTVMALKLIEQANYRTLILVHTKDLMLQWQDRIRQFMKREATLVGSGIEDYSGDIVIAMLQTLHKRFEAGNDMDTNFGCVISDEVHHIPAKTFREVISHYYPKKLYGLTATPQRSDGMEILIFFLIGPIVHNVTDEELVQAGKKINPVVKRVYTKFSGYLRGPTQWQRLYGEMASDDERNALIIEIAASEPDHHHLILSKRVAHVNLIADLLARRGLRVRTILGSNHQTMEDRKQALDDMREGRINYLVATDKLAAEALDIPRLDRLHITIPTAFSGITTQQIGRIQRPHPEKEDAIIYDYFDYYCDVMKNVYWKRYNDIYNPNGWKIEDLNKPGQMRMM